MSERAASSLTDMNTLLAAAATAASASADVGMEGKGQEGRNKAMSDKPRKFAPSTWENAHFLVLTDNARGPQPHRRRRRIKDG